MNQQIISAVVSEVLAKIKEENRSGSVSAPAILSRPSKRMGVFGTAEEAAQAARKGQEQLRSKGIATRVEIVNLVKSICTEKAEEWGKLEFAETKIGRAEQAIRDDQGVVGERLAHEATLEARLARLQADRKEQQELLDEIQAGIVALEQELATGGG